MDFIKFITNLNITTIIIIALISLLITSLILIVFKIVKFIKIQSRYIRVKDEEYDELFTEIEHIVKGFISDIDVEENVVKVDEYQTEQNQLAIYTFTSEEDNDDDDTTINKKEGNNIVQPLATENTERKIFFSEKKDDSDKN